MTKHAALIERWRADRVAFAAELDVIDKDGERIAVRPSAMISMFQAQRSGWDIVLKPRQVWFTTWELAQDIWYFLTQPGARVRVVCQSDKDDEAVRELSERVRVMLGTDEAAKNDPNAQHGLTGKHPGLGIVEKSATHWVFGSSHLRIMGAGASKAAAEKKGRAGTIHRLHITEISSFEFAESTMNAILECVPVSNPNAEVVIESTPRGAAGLFYKLYNAAKRGANSFRAFFFAWLKHPEYKTRLAPGEVIKVATPREREMVRKYGASAEQIKWYREKIANKTQQLADQEYPMDEETCWLIAGRLFLDVERTKLLLTETREPARIERLRTSVADPLPCELRVWSEPVGTREPFVLVADPSEGVTGGDPCAAAVYRRATGEHVASLHGLWRTHEFAAQLDKLGRYFNNAQIVVERINHGHAVLNALLRLGIDDGDSDKRKPYPNVYHDPDDEKPGWKSNDVTRSTACEAFEEAHRTGKWSTPDRDALAEMQRFVIDKKGKPCAAHGANDDRVLTHIIGWAILSRPYIANGTKSVKGDEYRWGSDDRGFG